MDGKQPAGDMMKMGIKNLKEFIADRDATLLSLDTSKMDAYLTKYNGKGFPAEMDQEKRLGTMHKAITGLSSFSMQTRLKSKAWLTAHGWRSLDDGELGAQPE